jgi:parallel beta-helix repeat protein
MVSTTKLSKSTVRGLRYGSLVILLIGFGISNAHAVVPVSGCTVISAPGLYLLTNNTTARAADLKTVDGETSCILITADFVTLDLNGFNISGPGQSVNAFGIDSHYNKGTVIRNGSVSNFSNILARGISLEGASHTVEDVRIVGNGAGLTLDGVGMTIRKVHVLLSPSEGIICFNGFGNSVRDSDVSENGTDGIQLVNCTGNSVIGNTAGGNGGAGITVACPSLVLENVASQNSGGDIISSPPASCTQANNNPAP